MFAIVQVVAGLGGTSGEWAAVVLAVDRSATPANTSPQELGHSHWDNWALRQLQHLATIYLQLFISRITYDIRAFDFVRNLFS